MGKNKINKLLLKVIACIILLLIISLLPQYANKSFATEQDPNEGQYIRLTDTEKLPILTSNVGYYNTVKINQDHNGNKLAVKIEGSYYTFDYGLFAHANANIYYDVSKYSEKYHYLTMYVGMNRTSNAGNGVKFWTYTRNEENFVATGTGNWELKNETESLPGQNATFVKIDIRGAKYIRLQVNDNGANGNDHAVFINPMLITDDYREETNGLPDISEYDQKIKDYPNKDLSNPEYELLILQRKFVSNVGNFALKRMMDENPENEEAINWLMNDVKNLRYYILGGEPEGGYYNSLTQLIRLYKAYKDDFKITETTKYGTVLGDLYTRMAIAMSLTHSQNFRFMVTIRWRK